MPDNELYTYGNLAYKTSQLQSYAEAEAQPKTSAKPKPRIDVVPGGRSKEAGNPAHALAVNIAKLMVGALCIFAIVGFARVSLSAATVAEALQEREVTSLLEDARSSISELEVAQSSLSNPTRIKAQAAALGMAPATDVGVLDIKADIVAVDSDGALSLTASMDAKADQEGLLSGEAATTPATGIAAVSSADPSTDSAGR